MWQVWIVTQNNFFYKVGHFFFMHYEAKLRLRNSFAEATNFVSATYLKLLWSRCHKRWIKALWLAVPSPTTMFEQSEFFILA